MLYKLATALVLTWIFLTNQLLMKISLPQAPQCFAKTKSETTSSRKVPIRLNDLMGPFLIWGIGVGLSFFFFLVEMVFFRFREIMKTDKAITIQVSA